MRQVRVLNRTRGALLAERALVADGWWTRLRGLLGRPPLRPGEGLLLSPCRSVHTFGMRYPIDVLFLDEEGRVVAQQGALVPRRVSRVHRAAERVLELPAGTLARTATEPGDVLELSDPV